MDPLCLTTSTWKKSGESSKKPAWRLDLWKLHFLFSALCKLIPIAIDSDWETWVIHEVYNCLIIDHNGYWQNSCKKPDVGLCDALLDVELQPPNSEKDNCGLQQLSNQGVVYPKDSTNFQPWWCGNYSSLLWLIREATMAGVQALKGYPEPYQQWLFCFFSSSEFVMMIWLWFPSKISTPRTYTPRFARAIVSLIRPMQEDMSTLSLPVACPSSFTRQTQ